MPRGLLNRSEVLNYLACDEPTLRRYIKSKRITLYKIGGKFERFDKAEVVRLKPAIPQKKELSSRQFGERVGDFWRYNNFYIITFSFLAALILIFYFYRS